ATRISHGLLSPLGNLTSGASFSIRTVAPACAGIAWPPPGTSAESDFARLEIAAGVSRDEARHATHATTPGSLQPGRVSNRDVPIIGIVAHARAGQDEEPEPRRPGRGPGGAIPPERRGACARA